MTLSLSDAIAAVLRHAAEAAVMPRFRHLGAGEVEEKAPGDLVTIADREAEAMIAQGLAAIVPQARFVGEEACSRDPALLQDIDHGAVWIVDPIDGTGNFAAGRAPFALMAALLREGELVASCVFDPLQNRLVQAERGAGAWVNGERIEPNGDDRALADMTGIISDFSRPEAMATRVAALSERAGQVVPTRRCAGDEYPLVATGARDFALYWRSLVWDHAPGVLILREAGGVAARLDGAPYRPDDAGGAILLARSPASWEKVAAALTG